jgi:hypothetical protein
VSELTSALEHKENKLVEFSLANAGLMEANCNLQRLAVCLEIFTGKVCFEVLTSWFLACLTALVQRDRCRKRRIEKAGGREEKGGV